MSLIKKIARTLVGKSPTPIDEQSSENKNQNKDELVKQRPKRKKPQGENQTDRNDKKKRPAKKKTSGNRNQRSENGDSKRNDGRNKNRNKNRNSSKKTSTKNPRNRNNDPEQERKEPVKRPQKGVEPVDPVGFQDMGLREEILKAIGEEGYANPTPIQQASIGELVKGRDVLGCAQTGTGKTASFALPTLHNLSQEAPKGRPIRALILTPTRELALQISESYKAYGRYLSLQATVIYGGVGAEPQRKALKRGVDILVATPGRLLDLHNQGFINFKKLETLILDEADSMLDMGFLPDVKRIINLLPKKRQNVLFSATMPKDIEKLSMNLLHDPVKVEVAPVSSASERVEQSLYFVNRKKKRDLLLHILSDEATSKVLIFTRTKAIANRISKFLIKESINTEAIHGNKSQSARQRALDNFKDGTTRVLVATDLAARGLDVDTITHVINFDLPNIDETYVHRIGRTGRAEATGIAISFCDGEEQAYVRTIQNLIGKVIPVVSDHPFPYNAKDEPEPAPKGGRGGRPNNRPRSGSANRQNPRGRSGQSKGRSPSNNFQKSGGRNRG